MVPGILSIILTFLVLCSASPALQTRQILPRKSLNYIKCSGDLPYDSVPGISLRRYKSAKNPAYAICAAFESSGQNAGCVCRSETDFPDCQATLSQNFRIYRIFRAFCYENCHCAVKEERISVELSHHPFMSDDELANLWGQAANPENNNALYVDLIGPSRDATSGTGNTAKCHLKCTHADGGCGDDPNCACKATPYNQYLNKGNPAFFLASCMMQLSIGGRKLKREETDFPCPCNASYVSTSCCDAQGGLVWEAAELKLGVLKDVEDL